ncbi:flavin reductase family protein [Microbacterium sp. NPDC055683]
MFVDAADLEATDSYRLLVGSVVPRPIAWITSGTAPHPTNLAPFSAFAWVSQHPAMLGTTIMDRPDRQKDTRRNIEADGEYVVNIGDEPLMHAIHRSSESMPADVGEAEALGLRTAPSRLVGVERLIDAPISMECRLERIIRFSPTGGDFVVGRVVAWHIDDRVMRDGRIDTELLRPVGRLAGPRYTGLGDVSTFAPVTGG